MGKNPNGKIPDYDYSISTIHQLYFREIEAHRVSKVRKVAKEVVVELAHQEGVVRQAELDLQV